MVILLTGASSGVGKVTASTLVEAGHTVYGTSRRKQNNVPFIPLTVDVTDRNSIKSAIAEIIEKEGRIDILINNAGMGCGGSIEFATDAEIDLQMTTNFLGTLKMTQEVLPFMRKQQFGKIINISSVGGTMGLPYQGIYSASKFAVEGFSEALSAEVLNLGIKVILIEPGDFKTGFTSAREWSTKTSACSDYSEALTKARKTIENNENNGSDPIKIAKKILSIVEKNNNCFRYVVGNPIEKLAVNLKMLLRNGRLFHKILRMFHNI